MKYMSKKDNEIRMELGLVATHEDEYHLYVNDGSLKWSCPLTALTEFARRIRVDEREACAKLCDELANNQTNQSLLELSDCAEAIRARSNHECS